MVSGMLAQLPPTCQGHTWNLKSNSGWWFYFQMYFSITSIRWLQFGLIISIGQEVYQYDRWEIDPSQWAPMIILCANFNRSITIFVETLISIKMLQLEKKNIIIINLCINIRNTADALIVFIWSRLTGFVS